MADTEQPIEIPINVTGEEQAQQALNQTAAATTKLGQAAKSAAPPLMSAAEAGRKKAEVMAKLSSVTGSLSPIVGRMSAETAKLTQVFSTAGSTIGAMTSVVGGPLGIAIGAAVAATGLFVTAMQEQEEQARKTKEENDKLVMSLKDYIAEAEKARVADQTRRRLETNRGSVDEQQGKINKLTADGNALRQRRAEIESHLARLEASSNPALATRIAFTREQLQATDDNIDATNRSIDAANQGLIFAKQEESERGEIEKKANERHENARARQKEVREWTAAQQGMFDAAMSEGTGGSSLAGGVSANSTDDMMALAGVTDADITAGIDMFIDAEDAKAKAAEEAAHRYDNAWMGALSTVTSGASASVAALMEGDAQRALSAIAGIGTSLAAQGVSHMLQGTAELALGNPGAVVAIQTGAVELATGLAWGGVMGGFSGGVGGGGSSGGGAQASAPRDTYSGGSNDNGGGEETIVVNINSMLPDHRAGAAAVDAIRAYGWKRGKAARS